MDGDADASITFDEMIDLKFTNESLLAERALDDLLAATSASESQELSGAVDVLQSWDGSFEPDSVGAPLFFLWYVGYLEARQKDAAVAALPSAAARLLGQAGRLDVTWGDLVPMRADGLDLPATSTDGSLGVPQVLGLAPTASGELLRHRGWPGVADRSDRPVRSPAGIHRHRMRTTLGRSSRRRSSSLVSAKP